jgi:hypothetical protein
MRCLYCGKELALLKRWTGSGEFCSDAHRQRYQEEYNQLALNRLLQAKPSGESKPPATDGKTPEARTPGDAKPEGDLRPAEPKRAEEALRATPAPVRQPPVHREPAATQPAIRAPAPSREPERPLGTHAPVKPEPEIVAPAALAEFLVELPVPVMAKVMPMSAPELDFLPPSERALPQQQFTAARIELLRAGQVELRLFRRVIDCATLREARLDVREFVRTAPIVEVGLLPAGETGLETSGGQPMEIVLLPQRPGSPASWWEETGKEFAAFELELGALARLDFETTGLAEIGEGVASSVTENARPFAPPLDLASVETAVVRRDDTPEKLPDSKAQPRPEIVTRPMPLTLHGRAAGKAKPVQVFASAVSSGTRVQLPRSDALPLRPLIAFGKPAPTAAAKTDPAKQPAIDPRFANGKARKPQVRILAPEKQEPERRETEKKVAEKAANAAAAVPAAKQPPAEPKAAEAKPAPPAAPYIEPDLGLPKLNLTTSESFLSRLPGAARAALAAVMLLAIGGAMFFTTKGNGGKPANSSPDTLRAGTPLPAGEAGWVADFAPDPAGGARRRQVSVLQASLPLSNYRMELQGQIENKALGWVLRARDAKNFYVMKLEIVRPGPDPAVDLVRFAVLNGEEQPRTQIPLPMPVRLDTLYKVRVEALGDHLTTWVQDQKVDEWTDGSISAGGIGLYNERGERGSLKDRVSVTPLMSK